MAASPDEKRKYCELISSLKGGKPENGRYYMEAIILGFVLMVIARICQECMDNNYSEELSILYIIVTFVPFLVPVPYAVCKIKISKPRDMAKYKLYSQISEIITRVPSKDDFDEARFVLLDCYMAKLIINHQVTEEQKKRIRNCRIQACMKKEKIYLYAEEIDLLKNKLHGKPTEFDDLIKKSRAYECELAAEAKEFRKNKAWFNLVCRKLEINYEFNMSDQILLVKEYHNIACKFSKPSYVRNAEPVRLRDNYVNEDFLTLIGRRLCLVKRSEEDRRQREIQDQRYMEDLKLERKEKQRQQEIQKKDEHKFLIRKLKENHILRNTIEMPI